MKKLLFFFLLFPLLSSAQNEMFPLDENGNIVYTDVVKLDQEISQKILFSTALTWITETFKVGKAVLDLQDKDSGTIFGNGNFIVTPVGFMAPSARISFKIKIQVRDSRFKYTITNFDHKSTNIKTGPGGRLENIKPDCGFMFIPRKQWKSTKIKTDKEVKLLILSLTEAMNSNTDDDW